jgi:hypothetical protein
MFEDDEGDLLNRRPTTEDITRAAHANRAHSSSRARSSFECRNDGHLLCGEPSTCQCVCHRPDFV